MVPPGGNRPPESAGAGWLAVPEGALGRGRELCATRVPCGGVSAAVLSGGGRALGRAGSFLRSPPAQAHLPGALPGVALGRSHLPGPRGGRGENPEQGREMVSARGRGRGGGQEGPVRAGGRVSRVPRGPTRVSPATRGVGSRRPVRPRAGSGVSGRPGSPGRAQLHPPGIGGRRCQPPAGSSQRTGCGGQWGAPHRAGAGGISWSVLGP